MKDFIKFNKGSIEHYMDRKLKLPQQIAESFEYVEKILTPQKVNKLSDANWHELKNYNWCCIDMDNVTLLIRQYGFHFTFFSRLNINQKFDNISFVKSNLSIFTYTTDTKKLSTGEDEDLRIDNPFIDIDESFDKLLVLIKKNKVHTIWNNYSFVRPDYIEVIPIWVGSFEFDSLNSSNYHSIDLFNFACEELSTLVMLFYAENDMLANIKKLAQSDLNKYPNIVKINYVVEDNYFHDAGITFNEHGSEKFNDIYSLTRYYFDEIQELLKI